MKRNVILCLLAAVALTAGGCASKAPDPAMPVAEPAVQVAAASETDEISEEMASSEALDGFAAALEGKLKAEGLQVGGVTAKDGPTLGAVAGYGMDVNGGPVEFYLFDPGSTDQRTLDNLKSAQAGTLTLFGVEINGKTPVVNCALNGNVALFFPLEGMNMPHPDKEKILSAFSATAP